MKKLLLVVVLSAPIVNATTRPVSYQAQMHMWSDSPGNIIQKRLVLEQALNKAHEKYMKDKEAGNQTYMGGEFDARKELQNIKQSIREMGGRIQEREGRLTVIWPNLPKY